MNAIVWHGGADLRYETVAEPLVAPGQVLVDIALAGVCGSDLHPIRGHNGPRRPPLILGHEVLGRIDGRDGRYVAFPLAVCGQCPSCRRGEENLCARRGLLGLDRPGVFTERVSVPEDSLFRVPDELDDRVAVLVEPLATSLSALRAESLEPGSHVVVLGCGPIGLLAIHTARHLGLRATAVEPLAERRELAAGLGADAVHEDLTAVRGLGADAVIDAVGIGETVSAGCAAVRRGAVVVVIGLGAEHGPVPIAQVVRDGIIVRGHYAYTRSDFGAALDLLASDPPNVDWLTLVALQDTAAGIQALIERPHSTTKVIVQMQSS
jgi:threonine dehydrogenase-like Zn-dependent dehydrogenase